MDHSESTYAQYLSILDSLSLPPCTLVYVMEVPPRSNVRTFKSSPTRLNILPLSHYFQILTLIQNLQIITGLHAYMKDIKYHITILQNSKILWQNLKGVHTFIEKPPPFLRFRTLFGYPSRCCWRCRRF